MAPELLHFIIGHIDAIGRRRKGQNPYALADADGEREVLARIIHEIERLEPLLVEAKTAADPDQRIHFHYEWLRKDLERVRQGIQEHINAPRAEPRTVVPLRGDYRR